MRTMKSATEMSDNRFLGSLSTSSIRSLLHRSISAKQKANSNPKSSKSNIENTPPVDLNIQVSNSTAQFTKPSQRQISRSDSHTEVIAPPDPPIKKEIVGSDDHNEVSETSDPSVKVVVRIKTVNEVNTAVRKLSSDSLCIGDRKFTFDSVLDSNSNQEDIFQLVGIPLVQNALAGYNTSVLSYGQTGCGKTYTLWGPPRAMVEDPSPSSHQGIVPRIFQMLFSEIQKEQENSEGKQINYQCRCSFLEVYNEKIGDLLDPTQRNLEIKDDTKNGLYVENLTEEYVSSYDDIMQILIKGLSSRKVGATSINSKSSRSHIVFTFVIESWCKGTSSKCFSSSRTSRMTLVDLAGSDRHTLDDASRQCVKEGKNVKKSLSQLGYLVHTLTTGVHQGKSEDVPYKGSCLTHLLRESLGGNAKLTVICAISPENINTGDTMSTLRFAQRVKCIKNEPVINEISEDHVNDLSDQIRQLKEELIRAKSDVHNSGGNRKGYFSGRNVRDSLNQLRVSLNRSLILPRLDHDYEEDINVNEDDVRELHQQIDQMHSSCEENLRHLPGNRDSIQSSFVSANCEAELMSEDEICTEEIEIEESEMEKPQKEHHKESTALADGPRDPNTSRAIHPAFSSHISISTSHQSPILPEPTFSESPKIGNNQRRSMAISSSFLASQNNVSESSNFNGDALGQSLRQSEHIRSSLHSSKIFPGPTESLAASLHRGLQIIDYHQKNSSSRSSVSFSFEHLTLKPCPEVDKANASLQTLEEKKLSSDGPSSLLCLSCRQKFENNQNEIEDSIKTWVVAVDEAANPNKPTDQVANATENDLAEATKRQKELETVRLEQAAKIEQLNHLLEQYKYGKEHQIIPFEAPRNQEQHSPRDENKLLKCNDVEDQSEVIKEVQEVHMNTYFDISEREALLEEIKTLKSKLNSYAASSPNNSTDKLRSSLLSRSIQLRQSVDYGNNTAEELEKERQRWTEMESDWISLTEELRVDLEAHRRRAEKVGTELKLEKQCTEELDDALHRAVLGHARFVEQYTELQEKYNDLAGKHRAIMEGIAEVKRAAAKAGAKGHGSRFAKSLAAELSALRVEREREREFLKKENKSLKIQLRDTAEAVHAAGELLVRLREAEQAASAAEDKFTGIQEENDKLKKQIEKIKRKHKMEMVTMKQYLAESRLPESALQPLYREDSDVVHNSTIPDDDQAWRAEFGAIYQDHY